jgi:adenine C2-methylase RlmN of 23S rRNA A2503 and tRNA A37
MGMGEPLDNYDNVLAACRVMVDRRRWNLAFGHVTVSTVGIVPKMRQLTRDFPDINLALSLHAPNEVLRQKIVPTSKVYSIHDMIDALDQHMMTRKNNESSVEETQDKINPNGRKKAMIEYVMRKYSTV